MRTKDNRLIRIIQYTPKTWAAVVPPSDQRELGHTVTIYGEKVKIPPPNWQGKKCALFAISRKGESVEAFKRRMKRKGWAYETN